MKHFITVACLLLISGMILLPSCSDDPFAEPDFEEERIFDEADLVWHTCSTVSTQSANGMDISFRHLRFDVAGLGTADIVIFCADGDMPQGRLQLSPESFEYGCYRAVVHDANGIVPVDGSSALLAVEKEGAACHMIFDAAIAGDCRLHIDRVVDSEPRRDVAACREMRNLGFESGILRRKVNYSVLLPPSWDGRKRFPVLYLLHGAFSPNTSWLDDGDFSLNIHLASLTGICDEMVVVMPSGSFGADNTYFCNGYLPGMRYEDFFMQEFLPEIERRYCVDSRRENRVIAGYSMGGFGALLLAGSYPEIFGGVYAMSPRVWREGLPDIYSIWDGIDMERMPRLAMEIGYSDFLFSNAEPFHRHLGQNAVEHRWITRPGDHDWSFWRGCITHLLYWI